MRRLEKLDPADVKKHLEKLRTALAERLEEHMKHVLRYATNRPVELERICGVDKNTIGRMLKPKAVTYSYPKLDNIAKVCLGLGIDPIELFMDAPTSREWHRLQNNLRAPEEVPSRSLKSRGD